MPDRIAFADLSWSDVETRVEHDCRVVIPLGATEEHGHLSLATDTLFVTRVVLEAASRVGVMVAPTLPFGASAFAIAYPGTVSLRTRTICAVIEDVADCLYRQGFRRLVFATGHGGNEVITGVLSEIALDRPRLATYYVDAWAGMKPLVQEVEREGDLPPSEHAAWHEDFPFTRVGLVPNGAKKDVETPDFPLFPLNPRTARANLGDGVVSGLLTIRDDQLMCRLFEASVEALAGFLGSLPATVPEDPAPGEGR